VYGTPRGHILGGPNCPGLLHSQGDMEVGAKVASTSTSHEPRHEVGDVFSSSERLRMINALPDGKEERTKC
jgi:hypothetical protein